ncbi:MAG TPA: hypothetical protein VGJ32_10160 [Solirubrobacteraceae bacterium]
MAGPPERASWLDLLVGAQRWWAEPALGSALGLADVQIRILAELADGLVRNVKGQRVELDLEGRRVVAVVDAIRLRRSGDRYEGRLALRDVDWDGLPIEAMSVVARAVRIEPLPVPRLAASDIAIAGRSPLAAFVAWLDRRSPHWKLSVDDAGHVVGRRRHGGVAVFGELVVADHRLQVEIRGVRWRDRRVRLPRRLHIRRTIELPALPHGMSVVEARRRAPVVDFRLAVPSVTLPVTGLPPTPRSRPPTPRPRA